MTAAFEETVLRTARKVAATPQGRVFLGLALEVASGATAPSAFDQLREQFRVDGDQAPDTVASACA